jgi:energy-coupling factor transporter ATP-binding protein EcfA2
MDVEITLKNYRCFPDSNPARIRVKNGFTAFVGPNNAGKSALIRFFVEFRPLFEQIQDNSASFFAALRGHPMSLQPASVVDQKEVFSNRNPRDLSLDFRFYWDDSGFQPASAEVPASLLIVLSRELKWTARLDRHVAEVGAPDDPSAGTIMLQGRVLSLTPIYQVFKRLKEMRYVGPFRNAINVGTNQAYFDIQVGASFIDRWRAFKTGPSKIENERIIQLTEDIRKIFGFETLEINAASDGQSLQVNIDRRSYRLHELGAGLAQFILVLGNVAIEKPSFLLIDEPELGLHPSLQIDFLTTLASYCSEGVLFATHNIGLARASSDRVYTVRRREAGWSEVRVLEQIPRLCEFLGEMGFSAYRDLGYECVLLVEGSSEVKTIQQLLRMYRKDHRIVLLSLGGSDMIKRDCEDMLMEVKRISETVFALIDSERDVTGQSLPASRQGFVDACEAAHIVCHVLERRATENYFTGRAIQEFKGQEYRELGHYERLGDAPKPWSKSENWRIARAMSREEIDATDLGGFLRGLPA